MTVGCIEESLEPDVPSPGSGNDVKFGLSLEDPKTRTIYGAEANGAFPIYWSEGDTVLVASPQCASGRTSATYVVTPVAEQSFAKALTRTGDYGVQWGSADASFYSVYPSSNASWTSLTAENVTAKLNIASQQSANIVLNGTTYSAADMSNVIMYANTPELTNGSEVILNYKPYSTILEFEMSLGAYDANESYGTAKVVSMTLTAPEGTAIAGDFTLKFNGVDETGEAKTPTISSAGNNSNVITMLFTTQPMLTKENSLKAKIAVIPNAAVTSIANWTLAVEVLEGNATSTKTYTKTLNTNATLKAGKIHKIKLPKLTPSAVWTYNTNNWIPTLYDYKNIYLTELSLPGAWYAGAKVTDGYQSTQSISDLWNAGVRAFAVETKCVSSSVKIIINYPLATPSDVVVSGTADNASLSTASGTNTLGTGSGDKIYKEDSNNITLKTIFENIIACLKAQETDTTKEPEFAVLVLSYADGGTTGMRPVDFGAWLELLYDSYNSLSAEDKGYIYSSEITANTTVNDVLNKLIIKVNVDAYIAQGGHVLYDLRVYKDERTYSYDNNLPALLSYNPFLYQVGSQYYSTPLFSKISWKKWTDAEDPYRSYTTTITDDFLWCFCSANRTQLDTGTDTTIPQYTDRKAALKSMINHSKELTESGDHNIWFYFNAGGTEADSHSDESTSATSFATEMNPWLLKTLQLKSDGGYDDAGNYVTSDPSPLGIVMFNQCTNSTYNGPEIIKTIIEMNNKFKLQRAPAVTPGSYSSTATVGGDAF